MRAEESDGPFTDVSADVSAGDASAQFELAKQYFSGIGCEKNYELAFSLFQEAAKQGHARAQNNLGMMYRDGRGVAKDEARAVEYFRQAAEQDYAGAQNNLGEMYFHGCGIAKNEVQALGYFQKAAGQGNAAAQYNLGEMHRNGCGGLEKNNAQAVKYFKLAAEQGYAAAQYSLGIMHSHGYGGLEKNNAQAVKYFKLAAEQGHAAAQNSLGEIYLYGWGVEKNRVLAAKYFWDGFGKLKKSNAQAVQYFQQAAEQGHAAAQNSLGEIYLYAWGVPEDQVLAAEYFRQAAEQGHAGAQYNLGLMYRNGRGVPKDKVRAAEYFRQAAEQGSIGAQMQLAAIYIRQKQDNKAADLLGPLARQGNVFAQANLFRLWLIGCEVEIEKLPWFPEGLKGVAASKNLGEGSYGAVFHLEVGSESWVIKIFYQPRDSSFANERRVYREIAGHPNFLCLLPAPDRFSAFSERLLFFAYQPAEDLDSFSARLKIMRIPDFHYFKVMQWALSQVLIALEYLHKKGFMHNDLKPENTLVTRAGEVKLIDFGASASPSDSRNSGTLPYVSPEARGKEAADFSRVDEWAFAIMAFLLLLGERQANRDKKFFTREEVLAASDREEPRYGHDIHQDTIELLSHLLVHDPKARPSIETAKTLGFFRGIDWGQSLPDAECAGFVSRAFSHKAEY